MASLVRPSRRSIRLARYDYSQSGCYFFTVCVTDHRPIFGTIVNYKMECNRAGEAVWKVWRGLPDRFAGLRLDAFIVMPNHVHGVLVLSPAKATGAASSAPTTAKRVPALGKVVRAFKSLSSIAVNRVLRCSGPLWQRNYYEHIVRNGEDLDAVRLYIDRNPAQWANDRESDNRLP